MCVVLLVRAGNGDDKVRKFVDIFYGHPPKPVEEEINTISPHLTPKIPPLVVGQKQ